MSGLAGVGQYLLPVMFVLGAMLSAFTRHTRKKLYNGALRGSSSEYLNNLSGSEFTQLAGEYFRRQGYRVKHVSCGTDLIVKKGGEKICAQCKHIKAEAGRVEGDTVQELLKVVERAGASGGYLVTSGEFARDAVAFADANNISLLDGGRFIEQLRYRENIAREQDQIKREKSHPLLRGTAVLLAITAGAAALYYTDHGRSLLSHFTGLADRGTLPASEAQNAEKGGVDEPQAAIEEKDYVFSSEQVEKAMLEILAERRQERNEAASATGEKAEELAAGPQYLYVIELNSGGVIYSDDVEITETSVTYRAKRGVVVSIERQEVKSVRRIRADE